MHNARKLRTEEILFAELGDVKDEHLAYQLAVSRALVRKWLGKDLVAKKERMRKGLPPVAAPLAILLGLGDEEYSRVLLAIAKARAER